MIKVFVSSTVKDLVEHREAVNEVLLRMKAQVSAMEFFGSRADEPVPACKKEIDHCDILVGIYAWRYGWQPSPKSRSVTEQEFDHAQKSGKKCLCYLVDESYPWPPNLIDTGESALRLGRFKTRVSKLVRSRFGSPDNLAKQIAADLAREMAPATPPDSFGGLVGVNWHVFSTDLQVVLATAYAQARRESDDGVVATRHVVSALAHTPNTARCLLEAFRRVPIQPLRTDITLPSLQEMFAYDRPVSGCVLASMTRLLPTHSPTERMLALELAVDLLKHGTGTSVIDFRHAGVDAAAVDKTVNQIKLVAGDIPRLKEALLSLSDAEVLHVAFLSEVAIPQGVHTRTLRDCILSNAVDGERLFILVGELMRRHPNFVTLS